MSHARGTPAFGFCLSFFFFFYWCADFTVYFMLKNVLSWCSMGNFDILWFSWPVRMERLSLVLCLPVQITVYALTLLLCLLLILDAVYLYGVGSAFCRRLHGTSILLGHVGKCVLHCQWAPHGSVCNLLPRLLLVPCAVSRALPLAGGSGWLRAGLECWGH